MKTSFKNVIQLLDYYKDDTQCVKLLEQQRWAGKPVCPHCGSDKKHYVIENGNRYKCADKECRKKFSVTVGTIFENSKISLRIWFAAIYLISAHKKGISSHQLSRDLGVTQKTAWFILHRVREMLKEDNSEQLGANNIVEADESAIGGKEKNKHGYKKRTADNPKYGKTRANDKEVVVALVERGGKIRVKHVENSKKETIIPIIQENIKAGATISTDEGAAYKPLPRLGYKHIKVAHVAGEYVQGEAYTNTLEGAFSLFKRGLIGIYHSVSPKHLAKYCNEFSYRYNTREITDVQRFAEVLTNANGRLKYDDLIHN